MIKKKVFLLLFSCYLQVIVFTLDNPSPSHLPNVAVQRLHMRGLSTCNIATGVRVEAERAKTVLTMIVAGREPIVGV
jgi:hypothetical protein